ncbi:class 1b ribonucleoside-diphosphate reductase subunit alpha (plasmid) [Borrelia anserina]|uniref:Ribonucleoside-diphosphate reductase n=2 Tax=Borrelia anserina TaxID=143 RepID=W5SVE1_BORAN|nr:class 1b ribonucleoside-diphosphate reductase subunit alpha [Borrelia anserina]AHH08991.1 Ribonucleoside-diphosphate reductase alpha chain [Borrelia anserina BA2]AHX39241.1 ribonucleoside reductase subunit alpha [Borrelia anserina Es]APR65345.1 Ribonucleoside diphosphate reductase alpha chain [Borrelia anserina Es]UPA07313.1 class 1b ribonucleoside-diphosphate reductase subunit alpha [Borrelia anserina]
MRHLELNNEIMVLKDGFYRLEKDLEALSVFLEEVKSKSLKFKSPNERMHYLIDNNLYEDFYENYSEEQILEIYELVRGENFKFKSYMSASKFYKDYALKMNDGDTYLESYEDRIIAVSLSLASGNFDFALKLALEMIKQRYQPATPTFLNAGKKVRGELVSCFLLEVGDSLNSITFNISSAMQLSKIGGGVALNLSNIRARGEEIRGICNIAKGIIPVMKLLEDGFSYADQMGQRKGAGAVYLNIFHYDIEDFLDTKKINADEKSRVQTLSLGVIIPDKFFDIAKMGQNYYAFAPYSLYKATGRLMNEIDFDKEYDALASNPDILKKEISARDMLVYIARLQFESGYPYIMYSTACNLRNPLKGLGKIKMSNLCTEIFQIQTPSVIGDYGEGDLIGYDISCILGSLNIVNVVNSDLEYTIDVAMRALTYVVDKTEIKNAPSIKKANNDYHSVGLGVMNLHGFLIKNKIPYESEEALDFVRTFFMLLNFYSLKSSMNIAKDKGQAFKDFEKSEYYNGNYFDMYLNEEFFPRTATVERIFSVLKIPGKGDWENLKRDVQMHGLYHSYRLAVAPTQSISYIQNATTSLMPIVEPVEARVYGNSTTYYPMPYLSRENALLFKSAYYMDMKKLIDLVSEAQRHVDQGISTLLYVTNETTTRELVKLYIYAKNKGLKSLYYTRNKNLSVDECILCAI